MVDILRNIYNKTVLRVLRFIGLVNSIILLSLFYYLILGPMAVVRRVLLGFKARRRERETYWREREGDDWETSLRRQF